LLVSVSAVAAAPDPQLDLVFAALAQRTHSHALYTEQVDSPLFTHPLHSSGSLSFDAPDRLEKKTLEPKPQDLIVEGDVITIVRGAHATSMRLSDNPQLSPLLNGIRAVLAGDRAALEKNFQLSAKASGSGWTLSLQPLASERKPTYKSIQIQGTDGTVQSVTLDRLTGERTTMTLSELTAP
jgi:outer membrane lipoprotein-sorting protein